MISKVTTMFSLTTAPTQAADAQPHSGGWSESWWYQQNENSFNWDYYASLRANMLPKQAAIIGYRRQIYTIENNRLIPGGSSVFKKIVPGNPGFDCDVPQMALELIGRAANGVNTSRFTLRGIPDTQVTNGEFAPTPAFKQHLTLFMNNHPAPPPYSFVGRDLSQQVVKIVSIGGGVLETSAPIPGVVANQSWIRFLRARDDAGKPITGSYLCTVIPAANHYTLQGMNRTLSVANGTVRMDVIQVMDFGQVSFGRIVVKKVGRPSSSYRGRASKRK